MTNIIIPDDTAKSRLHRVPVSELENEVATAGERIEAFWEKHPDGSILTEFQHRATADGEDVYTARVFVRKVADSDTPDATAHATRSSGDQDEITAARPQETAETSAVSRALRNLGILATPKKPAPEPTEPAVDTEPSIGALLSGARRRSGMSQKQVAQAMSAAGFVWTQNTVSRVERDARDVSTDEVTELAKLIGYETP